MMRQHAESLFESEFVEDRKAGCAGFDLYRTLDGKRTKVANVTYWDALGAYHLETFGGDIPVAIAQDLIAETVAEIKEKIIR